MRTMRNDNLSFPKPAHSILGVLFLLGLFVASPARAQYDYGLNYQTNIISGVASNWVEAFPYSNGYKVGDDTYRNSLQIVSGGGLFNNGVGNIGYSTGGSNNSVLVAGGSTWTNQSGLNVGYGGAGNTLTITGGSTVDAGGSLRIGYDDTSSNNVLTVNGGGSRVNGSVYVGNFGNSNQLVISGGGRIDGGLGYIGANSANNTATITGTGSVWDMTSDLYVGGDGSGDGNRLFIVSGGKAVNEDGNVGGADGSAFAMAVIQGVGSVWSNRGDLYVGDVSFKSTMSISGGGAVYNNNGYLGNTYLGNSNTVIVSSGGLWKNAGDLYVGYDGSQNTLIINSGGTVIASNMFVGFNAGAIGNQVTLTGGGSLIVNDLLDVQRGRLNSFGGTTTVNRLNVGASASAFFAGSRLSVFGITTNAGTVTVHNSLATFGGPVVNTGTWITDPTTNIFNADFINTESSVISAAAGDVYIFTNDVSQAASFINRSTNGAAWNTGNAKFVFNSTLALTQNFYAAGVNFEPIAPSSSSNSLVTGDWYAATAQNFALGTLEISNFSTVKVWDAFSGLGGEFGADDGQRAALYVSNIVMGANSYLIVAPNVELYFLSSNGWSSANYTLLGGGELHEFNNIGVLAVPEPTVALMWLTGAATFYVARRRRRGRKSA